MLGRHLRRGTFDQADPAGIEDLDTAAVTSRLRHQPMLEPGTIAAALQLADATSPQKPSPSAGADPVLAE
jgi:hypothetical protein